MKKTNLLIILKLSIIILVFFISCTKNNYSIDKKSEYICDSIEPTVGDLNIYLSINNEYPKVTVYIYKGKFEDGAIIDSIESSSIKNFYTVNLNSYYTAVAKYIRNNDTILVVDGEMLNKKFYEGETSDCWLITGGSLNLKLKY